MTSLARRSYLQGLTSYSYSSYLPQFTEADSRPDLPKERHFGTQTFQKLQSGIGALRPGLNPLVLNPEHLCYIAVYCSPVRQ